MNKQIIKPDIMSNEYLKDKDVFRLKRICFSSWLMKMAINLLFDNFGWKGHLLS
ncbi:hypothetical protein FD41_GL001352 [Lentilactobacillus farraginis DSM 18382 = JCM 14108]|uniref:Uncharacterized protein n=1 Tax=Lentilactobacillus farraginis DSM 18382 = JCM 14108 TaxID=1423743 RepID=X0P9Z1_9LACO|nr:hypothetical protein FD41_GL001352 [Lentilactobacillus farraginis DSM 18382 = JCM 14108]GAF36104.1 hypothetical protein JCM14108_1049 [Lentilactobacillus farraginis DSM 18382 = JCM 14108]